MMHRLVKLKQPIWLYLEDTMNEEEIKKFDLTDHQLSFVKSIYLKLLIRSLPHCQVKSILVPTFAV